MKILITGVNGQLGHDVLKLLNKNDKYKVYGTDIFDLDITNQDSVEKYFLMVQPNVVIHCAAYTAVDRAEDEEKKCMEINVNGTKNLVEQAKKYKSKFIYISTDYVFDGTKKSAYNVQDKENPQSVYGMSKYLGELETKKIHSHFIIRISWVFGKNGNNFVDTMLKISKQKDQISVINDQIGSPTYTKDLSKFILELLETKKYGTYHMTNQGFCSWYEFAVEIFRIIKKDTKIIPINSNQFFTKAKRPKNSLLNKSKNEIMGFNKMPDWKNALKRYLKEIEVI